MKISIEFSIQLYLFAYSFIRFSLLFVVIFLVIFMLRFAHPPIQFSNSILLFYFYDICFEKFSRAINSFSIPPLQWPCTRYQTPNNVRRHFQTHKIVGERTILIFPSSIFNLEKGRNICGLTSKLHKQRK